MPSLEQSLHLVSLWALPVIVAITFHEAAHAFAAWRLGDDTAYCLGRVTFNPVRHIDPFGTLALPGMMLLVTAPFGPPFMFGYAKPVPVAVTRLRNPRWSMVLVAAAGPAANLLLAFTAALLVHAAVLLPGGIAAWTIANLANAVVVNMILAVFNLIPLPPLDGGRIAVGLLPYRLALPLVRLERFGLPILIGMLFVLPLIGRQIGHDLNLVGPLVLGTVAWLVELVVRGTGLSGLA